MKNNNSRNIEISPGAQQVLAAPTLQAALDRYLAWRGIGNSAVDLIPDSIRQPTLPIGFDLNYMMQQRAGVLVKSWAYADPKHCAYPSPGRLKLGTLFVRSAWSLA